MAFAIKATLEALHTFVAAEGHCRSSSIGEPKSPPSTEIHGAIFMARVGVTRLFLSETEELHIAVIRLYRDMLQEPINEGEFELAALVQLLTEDMMGDFDLGGTIRQVDAGGIHGTPLNAEWGYIDVGGTMFRTVDIFIPMIVDGSAALVQ